MKTIGYMEIKRIYPFAEYMMLIGGKFISDMHCNIKVGTKITDKDKKAIGSVQKIMINGKTVNEAQSGNDVDLLIDIHNINCNPCVDMNVYFDLPIPKEYQIPAEEFFKVKGKNGVVLDGGEVIWA